MQISIGIRRRQKICKLNDAEQKLTEKDGIISRQDQELFEAKNTIDSQKKMMAIQASFLRRSEEENESLKKEISKLKKRFSGE